MLTAIFVLLVSSWKTQPVAWLTGASNRKGQQ
jgi:hypothetical protein